MSEQKGAYKKALTASTTTAGGDALGVLNPEGADVIITKLVLDVTTPATGSATVDIGVGATATTSDDTLLDGVNVGAAAILADNIDNQGTNGKSVLAWGSAEYLTVSPSATLAGLEGNVYVEWIRV